MPVVPFLAEFIGYGGLLLAIFGFFSWRLKDIYKPDNAGRDRWTNRLGKHDWPRRYVGIIDHPLNWLDRHLTPELAAAAPSFTRNSAAAAWSRNALGAMLSLALAYPILSLVLQWALTGDAAAIGDVEVIPNENRWWARAVAIGALSCQAFIAVKWRRSFRTDRSAVWIIVPFSFAGAVAVGFTGADVFAIAVGFPGAGAFAVAVAGSFAGAAAFAIAGAGAFAGAVAFAGAFTGAFALTLTIAFIGAFAGVGAVAFAQDRFGRSIARPALFLSGYAALLAITLFFVVDLTPGISTPSGDPRGVILFLGVLPILNGLSDFLSLGASRYYLRAAETARTAMHRARLWLYDAGAALGSLLLFALTAIAFITFAVPGDGRPLADLPVLFADIRANPDDYWWLAFMLLSTLIPSLIHLVILAYSAFCFTPHRLRRWIAENIDAGAKGDRPRGRDGALGLVVLCTFSLWLPTVALVEVSWLLWTYAGGLRDITISAAEGYHAWLMSFGPE